MGHEGPSAHYDEAAREVGPASPLAHAGTWPGAFRVVGRVAQNLVGLVGPENVAVGQVAQAAHLTWGQGPLAPSCQEAARWGRMETENLMWECRVVPKNPDD